MPLGFTRDGHALVGVIDVFKTIGAGEVLCRFVRAPGVAIFVLVIRTTKGHARCLRGLTQAFCLTFGVINGLCSVFRGLYQVFGCVIIGNLRCMVMFLTILTMTNGRRDVIGVAIAMEYGTSSHAIGIRIRG